MINSCMSVAASTSTDPMHGFLRDKQAWENAISMYQGPDPLDHWYNYICWYENHIRGDPENKFRETLERCLALFEHSDFYKQDLRMVRLWLKYIEMQTHPLHFYQVLYQRGVGRQVAAFYIGWATYYQSIHAMKEAESVYSLAFQEKAQSFEELHHSHNKFLYLQASNVQMAIQHQQQQQQQLSGQQLSQHTHSHSIHYQQTGQSQTISPQHQQPQPSPQPQQSPHLPAHVHSTQHQSYHRQQPASTATASNSYFQPHAQENLGVHQPNLYQQNIYQNHTTNFESQTEQPITTNQFNGSNQNPTNTEAPVESVQSKMNASNEFAELDKTLSPSPQIQATQGNSAVSRGATTAPNSTRVNGCKLPRKFAPFCRNNYETWKPALFLEEPEDPDRRCHYTKQLVYPGTGFEYSPEELRAKKYINRLTEANLLKQQTTLYKELISKSDEVDPNLQEFQEIGAVRQKQQCQSKNAVAHTSEENVGTPQFINNKHRKNEHLEENGVESIGHSHLQTIAYTQTYIQQHQHANHMLHHIHSQQNQNEKQKIVEQESQATSEYGITLDDLEDQIEASTIRLGENKTIKIKFKKERQQQGHVLKGNNYVIEGIYQQEGLVASPSTPEFGRVKNGHSFHPYSVNNTSTPKSVSKRYKSKLKRINKLPIEAGSSSNSSSTENGCTSNGNNMTIDHIKSAPIGDDVTFNDNANYSFSSAVALDNSQCSLTSAVGRLNFREASSVYNTSNVDISTYQENSYFATQHDAEAKERRLRKAHDIIDQHLAKEAIDPFNSELCRAFLTKLDFPGTDDNCANYKILQTPLPKISNTRSLNLPDGVQFNIDKEVGRGSYGSVYKATDANTGNVVALKFQKPPNTWEIYICDQVLKRIKTANILPGLMDISAAIIAPNASIIATEFSPFGSLLDINNKIRQATTKVMHESLVMHFSAQICNIINHLHINKIIHADIKPDNFLLMRIPNTEYHYPSLRLIDFGCAIDMTLFPDSENTKFRKVIQTDGFTCIEMQEGRPWSYETDLFCIAGTVHVMLLGEYMQLQKRNGIWDIKQKLPRYLKKHVWATFFNDMLNIKSTNLPNLNEMRHTFDQEAARMDSELQSQIRTLSNILHRR